MGSLRPVSEQEQEKQRTPVTERGLYPARLLFIRTAIDLRAQKDEDGEPGMGD